MCMDNEQAAFRLSGKVVEIVEEGGRRKVKLALEPWAVIDLGDDDVHDLHLGDRLGMEATLVAVARAGNGHAHAHVHGHAHAHANDHVHDHDHPHSHGTGHRPSDRRRS